MLYPKRSNYEADIFCVSMYDASRACRANVFFFFPSAIDRRLRFHRDRQGRPSPSWNTSSRTARSVSSRTRATTSTACACWPTSITTRGRWTRAAEVRRGARRESSFFFLLLRCVGGLLLSGFILSVCFFCAKKPEVLSVKCVACGVRAVRPFTPGILRVCWWWQCRLS